MAYGTIAEQIAELETERTRLKTAIAAAQSGTSSFTVDGMSVTNFRLSALRGDLVRVEKSLQRLYRGGRGLQIDMSHGGTDSASTDNTVYTKVQA